MRTAILLVALLLAGCATPGTSPTNAPSTSAPISGWALDCSLGPASRATNASWGQDCEARASKNPGSKTEMWIAVNPTDPNNVVIGSKDLDPESSDHCVWNGLSVTKDGGKTWTDVAIGGKYKDRKPSDPTYGYQCNTDPDFQFTKDGALHYGVEMYGLQNLGTPVGPSFPVGGTPASGLLSGFKILLATSKDGGLTWPTVITYQPDLLYTTDYSRMTIDPVTQAIIEAIGSDGGVGCHVLVSTDGGASAKPPVEVATPYGPACGSGGNTAIAVSPKGVTVLMGGIDTQDQPGGPTHPVVVRSTDDGQTWVDSNEGFPYKPVQQFKESKFRDGTNIELAYDLTAGANKGRLYAVYAAADKDEADIFVRVSKDDGKTWGEPVMVNVPDDAKSHQWMPNLGVAGDGSIHVFYMDKAYDPAHKLIDMKHAVSSDGGATWMNERVSTVSFDGDLGVHQTGVPFFGDYLGVACTANDCWAGFPDSSGGGAPVTAAAHVHMGS